MALHQAAKRSSTRMGKIKELKELAKDRAQVELAHAHSAVERYKDKVKHAGTPI